jgi:hypothetical protein
MLTIINKILAVKEQIEWASLTMISIPTIIWLNKVVDVFGSLVAILVGLSLFGLNLLKGIELYKKIFGKKDE